MTLELLKLLAAAVAFWAAYYLDVAYVRDYCRGSKPLSCAWYGLLNLLFVVPIRPTELAPSLAALAVQLLLAAFFMARLVKLERQEMITQVAWNAATLWKWLFTCAA